MGQKWMQKISPTTPLSLLPLYFILSQTTIPTITYVFHPFHRNRSFKNSKTSHLAHVVIWQICQGYWVILPQKRDKNMSFPL